jgi:hypothetical protein
MFKRGLDPLVSMGIGRKLPDGGLDISNIENIDEKLLLEGFILNDIYLVSDDFIKKNLYVCSGKNSTSVIIDIIKKESFSNYINRWVWYPSMFITPTMENFPAGGLLKHTYKDIGNWINSGRNYTFNYKPDLIIRI